MENPKIIKTEEKQMTKQDIKEYVKNHKLEIATVCACAAITGVYYIVTAKERANFKEFKDQLKAATSGCEHYMTANTESVSKYLSDNIIEDRNGVKFDVNGIMFFGNALENQD